MKTFLVKYKWTILYWLIYSSIVLFFAPKQKNYYLDDDIRLFKENSLTPILMWTGVTMPFLVLLIVLAKTKSIKQSALSFLYGAITVALFLFFFRDLVLTGSLFINRQFKRATLEKTYLADYQFGVEQTKENFNLYDISAKQLLTEKKLINRLYHPGLKQNDTLTLKFYKGLLGIAFQAQPFIAR